MNKKNGWDIRIHVDGASGAMVAPFIFPGVLPGFFEPAIQLSMLRTAPFVLPPDASSAAAPVTAAGCLAQLPCPCPCNSDIRAWTLQQAGSLRLPAEIECNIRVPHANFIN